MAILATSDYPSIRAILDANLSSSDISDTVIGYPPFSLAADKEVIRQVPTAESMTGDDLFTVNLAAQYLCAAYMAPMVVRLTSFKTSTRDLDVDKETYDVATRVKYFKQQAQDLIDDLLGTETPLNPMTQGLVVLDFQQRCDNVANPC